MNFSLFKATCYKMLLAIKEGVQNFNPLSDRSIHSLKTALACIVGYVVAQMLQLPMPLWVVITVLVVMTAQSTLGGLLLKSKMRFIGTVAGAIFSCLIILLNQHHLESMILPLFSSTLFFSYVATNPKDVKEAGTLGAVTVAMILLTNTPTLAIAAIRFIEITIGISTALLVSKFIFPIRAEDSLKQTITLTLKSLQKHYDYCLTPNNIKKNKYADSDIDQQILDTFARQRVLIHEVGAEVTQHPLVKARYELILGRLRKIYRSINLMAYCYTASPYSYTLINNTEEFKILRYEIKEVLQRLAEFIQNSETEGSIVDLQIRLAKMKNGLKDLQKYNEYNDIASVTSYIFSANYLIDELYKLKKLIFCLNKNRQPQKFWYFQFKKTSF